MSTLYVVRHGQARLFTDNYDRLSDVGLKQSAALGRHWIKSGIRIDAAWSGELKRQVDTASAVGDVFREADEAFPEVVRDLRLDEYPAEAIMLTLGRHLRETDPDIAILAENAERATEPGRRYRDFHRLLEAVIARWVEGNYDPGIDVPLSWEEWSDAVRSSLQDVMSAAGKGGRVAVFTSGGIVGVSVQTVLQAPAIKAAELNWRVHNASVTRYTFSGRERVSLDHFNEVSHLPPELLTYR